MELYFNNDHPRMIYDTWKYARVRANCEEIKFKNVSYYLCDARSYREAIESLVLRSRQYASSTLNEPFKLALIHATGLIVDPLRGDGFTLLTAPFEEWYILLEDYTTPEEYQV